MIDRFLLDPALRRSGLEPTTPEAQAAKKLGKDWLNPFAADDQIQRDIEAIKQLIVSGNHEQAVADLASKAMAEEEKRQQLVRLLGNCKRCPVCGHRGPLDWAYCPYDGERLAYLQGGTAPARGAPGSESPVHTIELVCAGELPIWSPNGQFLAYCQRTGGSREAGYANLFLRDLASGKSVPLYEPGSLGYRRPFCCFSWSPNGEKVAFAMGGDYPRSMGTSSKFLLGTVAPSSGVAKLLIADKPDRSRYSSIGGISWSPDSSSIVYSVNGDILVVDSLGMSSPVALGTGSHPFYTEDGRSVLFYKNRKLHTVSKSGLGEKELPVSMPANHSVESIMLSPRGRAVAYSFTNVLVFQKLDGTRTETVEVPVDEVGGIDWSNQRLGIAFDNHKNIYRMEVPAFFAQD